MKKDVMIAIGAYRGDNWHTVSKDLKRDLKQIGVTCQVIPRNHRYRVRFKSANDLHLSILAGILEPCSRIVYRDGQGVKYMDDKYMMEYRYVKQ